MSSRLSISLLLCILSLSLNTCYQAPAYVVSDTPLPQARMPVLNANNRLKLGENETSNVYLQSLDIQVEVTGNIASTRYTMVFKNKTDFVLEGELTFPLPDGRSVTHYALDINGKMRDAVPVEKTKATQTFEEIERRQVDPGLLERVEGNNFRTRIYPIPANGTRTITIGYEEELSLENNLLYYRLPMDYPNSLEKFAVKATVWKNSQKPLVPKSEKEIAFDIAGENYVASLSRENYRPSRSLIFALPVPSDIPQVMMQPVQGSNYFLASVAPKMEVRKKQWGNDLAIIWDVSLSGSQRNLQSEMEMLDIIFAENKNANINLYFLSNNLKKAAKGNWSEVRKILETAVFDGGTDFSKINSDNIEGKEILFFSDGISTLSDADFIKDGKLNRPVHCIVSSAKADYIAMRLIAGRTNGKFVNLNALSSEKLKTELLYETLQFLGTEHGNSVQEVYPSIATPVQGNFSVAGISASDNAELTLLFGFGSKVEKRIKVALDAKNAGSQVNTQKIWAQKKIAELDLSYEKNRAELAQLGKQFGIVTRGTSLMVLETIGDYVHFDIEPPASEPELLAEYQRIKTKPYYTEPKKPEEYNFLKEAVEAAENLKKWRDTDFSLKKTEKNSDNGTSSHRGMNINSVDVVGWMDNPSAVFVLDQSVPWFANGDELLAYLKREPVITIKPIKKDNEYLSKLTGNIFDDYQMYLKMRNDYANSPTFYFDIADWFYALGDKETATRILTSIAELEIENASLYKLLGYKLKEYGELVLQKFIYQKVIQWRPMEPQSYRDYALALADNGEKQAALDSLYSLLARSYSENIQIRSRGIAEVVVMEMNHLIAKNRLNTSNIDQRLILNIPVDIRVVINWNIDDTDIDVHVEDPSGEECYYGKRSTSIGGRLSKDITSGYGPEQFMLKKAIKGKYKVYTNYFSNRQFTKDGPATVMAEIFTRYADATEQRKVVSFQLSNAKEKDKKKIEIAEFEFSENAVRAEASEASGTFTDSRDGTKYRIAKIGNQVWMAENLKFHEGGSICYNYEIANCDKYGRLYNWDAAQNVCPAGWHLPSNAEWQTLADFVGGKKVAGEKLKAKSFGGTDNYGFSALSGGKHTNDIMKFEGIGYYGTWWSASEEDKDWAYYWSVSNHPPKKGYIYNNAGVDNGGCGKSFLLSVRCLQDGSESKKPSEEWVQKIAIYNGRVYLEIEKFTTPFYGISMRFTDKNLNKGSGSYFEVRKVKNGYAINKKDNVYSTLEGGLESYLKEYLEEMSGHFYKDNFRKDAYWSAFLEEGKVQLFIEIIKNFLDDEFLSAPFNDEWG